jgi:hypothetical protein
VRRAAGLCRTQCQLPARRHSKKEIGKGLESRDIPKPSPVKPRGKAVILPALTEAKLALYSTMRANRVGKAERIRPWYNRGKNARDHRFPAGRLSVE